MSDEFEVEGDEFAADDAQPEMDVRMIPLDEIVPNPWNPNEMEDETFNRLTDELQSVGMIDPIQVVPTDEGFRILGGEHRYHAAKVIGWKKLPCVVLSDTKWKDEDLQKFVTVRLNILHGKLNPTKMVGLYEEMEKKYGEEALQQMFAFTDADAWDSLLKTVLGGLQKSGLPKDVADKFKDVSKEIKTVEGLSQVLNQLFTDYGSTLEQSYMVFTFGGKDHLYIIMDRKMQKAMDRVKTFCAENKVDINSVMQPFTTEWASKVEKDSDFAAAVLKEVAPEEPEEPEDSEQEGE